MGCPGGMSTIRSGSLSIRNMVFHCIFLILGDTGASGFWLVEEKRKFSGTNQKPERWRPFGTGLVRHCPQGLFSPFFTFLRATFFRPFRLSLVPTTCPWVSEDARLWKITLFCDIAEFNNCLIIRSPSLCFCYLRIEAICHFHAKAIRKKEKSVLDQWKGRKSCIEL